MSIDVHSYALQSTAHQQAPAGLVDAFLDLFDGHDIPAVRYASGRRPGFYKAPRIAKRLAFESHALGAMIAGAYPFRGVTPWCGCTKRKHTCDGNGARYFLLDLDAHQGESDTFERVSSVLGVAWRLGLTPVVFASRGGNGAHVFVFLDQSVTTRVAHAAGRNLARLAGITSRCDVIPSAEHQAGFGTLHALPLSPMTTAQGGGVMFDSSLRPLALPQAISLMQWADQHRAPAGIAVNLAEARVDIPARDGIEPIRLSTPTSTIKRETPKLTSADKKLIAEMQRVHPQFKRAVATSADVWDGKRSSRDAYLVGFLRRQGLKPAAVVAAMRGIVGTKAKQRSDDYVWRLIETQAAAVSIDIKLAGQRLPKGQAKRQRKACSWAPWDARVAPPQSYAGIQSPWWSESVQAALGASKGPADGIVAAYLIDRYYRGDVRRRGFYASCRGIGKALHLAPRTVGSAVGRLRKRIPGALRVVPGVPHPQLRIANGFYVPERGHKDRIDWYIGPGRRNQPTLL